MNPQRTYCEHGAISKELKRLQRAGVIQLIHFPYDENSRSHHLTPSAIASEARYEDCNLAWEELHELTYDDFAGSEHYTEILRIIGMGNRRDALHVDSAFKSHCVCFVTADRDILDHAEQLQQLLGFPFFQAGSPQLSRFLKSLQE